MELKSKHIAGVWKWFSALRQSADGEFILHQILCLIREPMKFSAGAATACLLQEEIPPLSPKETQQTAKTWPRQPNRTRRSTSTEMSCSDLNVRAKPPDCYLDPGDPSFHRQSSKMFTRAVDHCDMSCGPTADSGDCYLSAQPQRIIRSLWLYVWFVPVHHMIHIWYGWKLTSLRLSFLWNIKWKIYLDNHKMTQNFVFVFHTFFYYYFPHIVVDSSKVIVAFILYF